MTWGMQAALRVSHRCSDSSCHLKTNVVSVRNLKQAALMSFLASWSHNLVLREIHLFSVQSASESRTLVVVTPRRMTSLAIDRWLHFEMSADVANTSYKSYNNLAQAF